MLSLQEIRKIHVQSWNELKKELDLGDPFWIQFTPGPISLPDGTLTDLRTDDIRRKELREKKASTLISIKVDELEKGSIIAYHAGTYFPSKLRESYTKEDAIVALVHENIHNCFCELNPAFHIIQNFFKYSLNEELKFFGKLMEGLEDNYAYHILYTQPNRFGVKKEDVIYHLSSIPEEDKISELRYIKSEEDKTFYSRLLTEKHPLQFEKYLNMIKEIFEDTSLNEVIKEPWYFMSRYSGNNYKIFHKAEVYYEVVKKILKEVWKREIDKRWVRLL